MDAESLGSMSRLNWTLPTGDGGQLSGITAECCIGCASALGGNLPTSRDGEQMNEESIEWRLNESTTATARRHSRAYQ